MRTYNKVSIGCIISCNVRNMPYVAQLILALAAVDTVLSEKLASGYVEYL